jgi:hypothetical protein
LGAVLGILHGCACIDEKWLAPIGDEIKSISIDQTKACLDIPKTVTELTRRVVNLMPVFMHGHISWNDAGETLFDEVETVHAQPQRIGVYDYEDLAKELAVSPVSVTAGNTLLEVRVTYHDESLNIRSGETKHFHVKITNRIHSQQWIQWKLHLPETWTAQPGSSFCTNLNQRHGGCAVTQLDFSVTPGEINQGRYDLLIEIHSNGRLQKLFMELPLLPA